MLIEAMFSEPGNEEDRVGTVIIWGKVVDMVGCDACCRSFLIPYDRSSEFSKITALPLISVAQLFEATPMGCIEEEFDLFLLFCRLFDFNRDRFGFDFACEVG